MTFKGLNNIKALKKWFTNIELRHKYTCNYSVGHFYTDPALSALSDYDYGLETALNSTGDYIAPVSADGVQIVEQMNPLIKVSATMVNSLQFNLSIQKNRSLQLSFSNNQLTEITRDGVTVGASYHIKDVAFSVLFAGKQHDLKSDIVLEFNLTYNSNMTNIRKINQNQSQISSGSEIWRADISARYALTNNLSVRLFFQTDINNPYIMNTYPNSTTKGGLTIRFSF